MNDAGRNLSGQPSRLSLEKINWIWLLLLSLFLFGPFYYWQPVAGLDRQGHWVISCIALTLVAWIVHPARLPRGVAGVLMMGLLLAGGLNYGDVFYGFTTAAVWIVVPAFLFGHVILETGLGRRITAGMLSRCGGNLLGISLALVLTGVLFSILTPSTTVRIAIVMPLVLGVIKSLNLAARSRESAFITLTAFMAILIPGNGWLTGSLVGPMNMGLLPPGLAADLDWFNYSRALILPWSLITMLLLAYLFLVFRPWQFARPAAASSEKIILPPLSGPEASAAAVLTLCFLGYLTTPLHGLESAAITAAALFLLFAAGTLTASSISRGVNWEMVLFLGSIMSLPRIFESIGLVALLGERLHPFVMKYAGNITLFILVITAVTLAVRFLDVAWGLPTIAVLFTFAPALAAAGIHPVVLCFLNGVIQYFSFFHYMSPFAIMSDNILEHRGWSERHLAVYGLGYILCVALSLIPAVWYWRQLGLI